MRDSYLTRLQKIPLEVSHSFFYSSLCHFLPPPSPPLHSSPLPLSLPIRRRRATTMVRASSSPPLLLSLLLHPDVGGGFGQQGREEEGHDGVDSTAATLPPCNGGGSTLGRHWNGRFGSGSSSSNRSGQTRLPLAGFDQRQRRRGGWRFLGLCFRDF